MRIDHGNNTLRTHTAQECPYTTPSCLPRTDGKLRNGKHTPIARINGFTDRASDPAAVDAFIKERTTYLIDLKSNSSGKESNSAKRRVLSGGPTSTKCHFPADTGAKDK